MSDRKNDVAKHPLYKVYHDIIKRCENKNCRAYPWYGGGGVKMCDEWRMDFIAFYNWAVSNGWNAGMEIDKDRIPRQLGIPAVVYSPEMCSILTKKENMNAHSLNRIEEYLGRKQTLSEWADEFNVNYKLLWSRLKRGWSFESALSSSKKTQQDTGNDRRKLILNTQTGAFYFGAKEASESSGIYTTNNLHCKLSGKFKNNTPFIYV